MAVGDACSCIIAGIHTHRLQASISRGLDVGIVHACNAAMLETWDKVGGRDILNGALPLAPNNAMDNMMSKPGFYHRRLPVR